MYKKGARGVSILHFILQSKYERRGATLYFPTSNKKNMTIAYKRYISNRQVSRLL
jgi:hypothetical protein